MHITRKAWKVKSKINSLWSIASYLATTCENKEGFSLPIMKKRERVCMFLCACGLRAYACMCVLVCFFAFNAVTGP